ncbi:M17 family peptidase N-terminal domain-containing protein [Mucilaginibacter paludis]|uniref:Peptidase M17 leucyl aminopeptidase domain protein n=1 Tax=Mucilaginibacter paludis DSM 18603 TaxID=714943 RepID=H1Y8I2_9SPHI|nr:M17 family peptidase N-terminal domain-containing protein [Mucilaginibacter paludis]EHQ25900.1 peptidase M17 leucyl aminopeptidase domain protein [Mucilaginibacter paludis DSM 18603]
MKTITNYRATVLKKTRLYLYGVVMTLGLSTAPFILPAQTKAPLPAVGTQAILGNIDGINIEVAVQSPSAENTPLQIACVFEYNDNDIFAPPALPQEANGMVHLDKGLNGIITGLRKSGKFTGQAFETLLIDVPNGTIAPQKLLLVGLGDRRKFDAEMMKTVGAIGMREALRLGVDSYAHASDLKDGGVDSPTGLVATNVLKGAIDAYRTQVYLKSKQMSNFKPIKKITLLAGQPFYQITGDALKKAID